MTLVPEFSRRQAGDPPEGLYEAMKEPEFYASSLSEGYRVGADPRLNVRKAVKDGFVNAVDAIDWSNVRENPLVLVQERMLDYVAGQGVALANSRCRTLKLHSLTEMLGRYANDEETLRGFAIVDAMPIKRREVYHCRVVFARTNFQTFKLLRKKIGTLKPTLKDAREELAASGVDPKSFEAALNSIMRKEEA